MSRACKCKYNAGDYRYCPRHGVSFIDTWWEQWGKRRIRCLRVGRVIFYSNGRVALS
jgi:hypothetical protein